jgi:hypothetical protein
MDRNFQQRIGMINNPALQSGVRAQQRQIAAHVKNTPGQVVTTPQVGSTFAQQARTSITPETKKQLQDVATLHEQFERAVSPKDVSLLGYFSHLSPEVLLKERNLLARLHGKGAHEIKSTLGAARELREYPALRRDFQYAFEDPRAAQFLEGSQKVPKAMRKRFLEMLHD